MTNLKKLQLLVIEDNAQMSEMISDYLQLKFPDAGVTVFNSGEKALEEVKTAPDIIILDYQLDSQNAKALNGLQILMKFKKLYPVPVIFLTAQEKPEVSANLIKYGAYDYVVKNQQAFVKLEAIINKILTETPAKKKPASQKTIFLAAIVIIAILIAIMIFSKGK